MRRIYYLLALLLCSYIQLAAQTTYTWQGGAVGDFQDATNWSPNRALPATTDILAFDVTTDVLVTNVPNQTIGQIRINAGTGSVSFNTNLATNVLSTSNATPLNFITAGKILAGDLLSISLGNTTAQTLTQGTLGIVPSSGGKIIINGSLTINGGTLDFDVLGTGGTTINGTVTYQTGVFICANASAITWATGSNYFHAVNGSAASSIPAAVWSGTSTCTINGLNTGTTVPGGLTGVTFQNFTWNCAAQFGNVAIDLGGGIMEINGNFNLVSTGSNALQFTGNNTINVNAYLQTGGNMVWQTAAGTTNLNTRAAFSHTVGGTLLFQSGTGAGTVNFNIKGNLTKSNVTTWSSTNTNISSQTNFIFSGSSSQDATISGTWNTIAAGRLNVVNTNTDVTGVVIVNGGFGGSLKVQSRNSNDTARCSSAGNFSGIGRVDYFATGGTSTTQLVYNGTNVQVGSLVEFPTTNGPANLSISNPTSVNFTGTGIQRNLPGRLALIAGSLNLAANDSLLLTNSTFNNQLSAATGYITGGMLRRVFPVSGLPTAANLSARFPMGSGANDRSLYVYFSATSITTGDTISVRHNAIVNATAISVVDNGITLDKRTNSNWQISTTGTLNLGTTQINLQAQGNNIGSVDNIANLRLTDALTAYGTLIASAGTNEAPLVGKSGLAAADINAKTLYIGSDNANALQIVTFIWNGAANTDWTNTLNWTGGLGFPSSPTEIAIVNTVGGNMPEIPTGNNINVYQLQVLFPASLTLIGTAQLNVFDVVTFTGTALFDPTSTFTYASSNSTQTLIDLPYGNLGVSGTATKTLPAYIGVRGNFVINGTKPTAGTGTVEYLSDAAIATQRIGVMDYYNLTVSGNRGGRRIALGNGILSPVSSNTIRIANVFNTTTVSNYVSANDTKYNTIDFSSTGSQNIPGFVYGSITNTGNGQRVFDPNGSANPSRAIVHRSLVTVSPTNNNILTGSRLILDRDGLVPPFTTPINGLALAVFQDYEVRGNLGGTQLFVQNNGLFRVNGTFVISATNFVQPHTTNWTLQLESSGAQAIQAYRTNTATNTPAWQYSNVTIPNGNRTITLGGAGTDTIFIRGALAVPSIALFGSGGFDVAGSTVSFVNGSGSIPELKPLAVGGNNYNNIVVNGGTRTIGMTAGTDFRIGGNLNIIGSNAATSTINLGNQTNNRTISVLGNLSVTGTSSLGSPASLLDFNNGSANVTLNLAGNLNVSGTGQITSGGSNNFKGNFVFNGTGTQQYSNTSTVKKGYYNTFVGNGTTATTLQLNNRYDLGRISTDPRSDSFTVANNATLNVGTQNIGIGLDDGNVGVNPVFNLNSGATLATANTGATGTAIEGAATNGTNGSIDATANLVKNYNAAASYIFNGATTLPFPSAIGTANNITLGAAVSLNKAITATGTLNLASFTLTQANNNLQFSGLASTTGSIFADQQSSLSISGSDGTVGTLRFATGGNTTGQFTINRPVTVALGSDLQILPSPLSGNFITGNAASILDINGNTLTINGAVTGPGFLAGNHTSNLTLGGNAGNIQFATGSRVLKNLTLNSAATATLSTQLDITAGTGANTEGAVIINGTAVLNTGNNLHLKSTINGTARIAQARAIGGYINGDVTVERYIASSAKRGWRLLSAPAYGPTINQAWQEGQTGGVNPGTGFGTIITSNQANWAANFFDYQTPGNSLQVYNPTLNRWDGFASTNVPISGVGQNKAYMLFIRGDRTATPFNGPMSTAATIRIRGTVFQGDLPAVNLPTAGQWAAIGNNYASPVNFLTLGDANIDQNFTVWDPKINGAFGLGAWVNFSASNGWMPVPAGGTYPAGTPVTRIESGQAFVVYSTPGNGNITFTEAAKLTGSNMVFRPAGSTSVRQKISTNLFAINSGQADIADGCVVIFSSDFENAIDAKDALKLNNFGDNIAVARGTRFLTIDARAPLSQADTVFLGIAKLKRQPYRMEFKIENFDATVTAFLEDKYLNNSTPLALNTTTPINFEVNSDAGSGALDRFRIVFTQSRPLPVKLTSVAAVKEGEHVKVTWQAEAEVNILKYEVEHSTDGRQFSKLGEKAALNASGIVNYSWMHNNVAAGQHFYRIKIIDQRGTVTYSGIEKVSFTKTGAGFSIYPNPVTDNNIGFKLQQQPAGRYIVRVLNMSGQVLTTKQINHPGEDAMYYLVPDTQMAAGKYQLQVSTPDNVTVMVSMLVL